MFKILKFKTTKKQYPAVSIRHDRLYINAKATNYLDCTLKHVIIEIDADARLLKITSVKPGTPDARCMTPTTPHGTCFTVAAVTNIAPNSYPVLLAESRLGEYLIINW